MYKEKIGSLSSNDIDFMHHLYQERIGTGATIEDKGVVICLDVLGWKNYSKPNQIQNLTTITAVIESIIWEDFLRCSKSQEQSKIEIVNLSDTILIFISDDSPYFFVNVFKALARFINDSFNYSFAFRGAISYGKYKYNKTKNIFTGTAVYEAATYCESTEWAGIIITDSLSKILLKNNDYTTLEHIHLIKYDDIPYKKAFLEKNSKCQDCLVLNPNRIAVGNIGEYIIDENLKDKYANYFSNNTGVIPKDLQEKYKNTIKFIEFINMHYKL